MYDYETEQVLSTGEPASRFRLSRVYPHDKVNSVLKVGYEDGSAFDEIFDISLGSVIVVDSENRSGHKVRWGDMGDIITYDMAGADCSKMIIQTRWGWPVITVIYN